MNWLPLGLMFLSPLAAQSVFLVEQAGLLDDSGIGGGSFTSGSAMAVVDMNGDRKDDIVRTHDRTRLRMEFQTTPNATFGHLSLGTLSDSYGSWCMCAADTDGNGVNDLVLGEAESGHDLYRMNADGTLLDEFHLPNNVELAQDGLMADLNNDGLIDVFVCDDVNDLHKWRNTGSGVFVYDSSLINTLITSEGHANDEGNYAILQTDFDGDGDTDFYLSKCRLGQNNAGHLSRVNRMFVNDGSENYTEGAAAAGLASGAQTWCSDFADVDNDGDLDCFILNHQGTFSSESVLLENNGFGVFTDVTTAAGLLGEIDELGNQALFRDFDNDGWVDLLVSSLNTDDFPPTTTRTYWYFENDRDGTFTKRGGVFLHANGTTPVELIHTFAVGDLNSDGFLDVYAGRGKNINGHSSRSDLLLMNQGNSNGFLSVMLVGATSNPNGIGARIEAHNAAWGTQVREVRGGEGYGIMNSLNTHFGLGTATEVTQLVVTWPSGTVDTLNAVPGDRFVSVYEGTGAVAMSFADWIADCYPGGGTDAEEDGDPDGDGVENLIEQVLGTSPKLPSGGPGMIPTVENDGGQDYFRVTVPRVPVLDVVLTMKFSLNGTTWTTPAGLEVLEDTQTSYVVRVPVDLVTEPSMMARLEAELVAP